MRNRVELNIPEDGIFTFKVKAGQTVKVGELVEITGDFEVQRASADSKKVFGVVYSGTVAIDGVNVGYQGDKGDSVSIAFKGLLYVIAGGTIVAGDKVKAGANGAAVKQVATATYVADEEKQVVGTALTGATSGNKFIVALG
ncbi:hypothetical protein [Bacillus cereus group sp. IBL03679]|uniref:hypothetical protein n=1 Tax=Bacillus cereus group sp. IBL03679 TaxID=3240095 RepID=UPI003D2F943D